MRAVPYAVRGLRTARPYAAPACGPVRNTPYATGRTWSVRGPYGPVRQPARSRTPVRGRRTARPVGRPRTGPYRRTPFTYGRYACTPRPYVRLPYGAGQGVSYGPYGRARSVRPVRVGGPVRRTPRTEWRVACVRAGRTGRPYGCGVRPPSGCGAYGGVRPARSQRPYGPCPVHVPRTAAYPYPVRIRTPPTYAAPVRRSRTARTPVRRARTCGTWRTGWRRRGMIGSHPYGGVRGADARTPPGGCGGRTGRTGRTEVV